MLDLCINGLHRYFRAHQSYVFLIFAIFGISYLHAKELNSTNVEDSHLIKTTETYHFFSPFDESSSLEQMAEQLVYLKKWILDNGYEIPNWKTACTWVEKFFQDQGIEIDEDLMEEIHSLLIQCELKNLDLEFFYSMNDGFIEPCKSKSSKKKHKKENKELKMSSNMAVAFCEALAGALCCIIPHPLSWSAGVALIGDASNRVFTEIKEISEKNELENKFAD